MRSGSGRHGRHESRHDSHVYECVCVCVCARSSAVAIDDLSCAATQLCVRVCALYVCAVAVCVRVSVVDAEVEDF